MGSRRHLTARPVVANGNFYSEKRVIYSEKEAFKKWTNGGRKGAEKRPSTIRRQKSIQKKMMQRKGTKRCDFRTLPHSPCDEFLQPRRGQTERCMVEQSGARSKRAVRGQTGRQVVKQSGALSNRTANGQTERCVVKQDGKWSNRAGR